jgi:gliding motility-associated-like protein
MDENGCSIMDSVLVEVIYPPLEMPNAFTPNGDGVNDEIRPRGGNIVEMEYRVYNRWGELLFKTTDPEESWNGTNQNGQPQPAGTYVYYVNATLIENDSQELETKSLKGNITLIK